MRFCIKRLSCQLIKLLIILCFYTKLFCPIEPEFQTPNFILEFRIEMGDRIWIFLFKKGKEKPFLIWPDYKTVRQRLFEFSQKSQNKTADLPGESFNICELDLEEQDRLIGYAFDGLVENREFILGRESCLWTFLHLLIPDNLAPTKYDFLTREFSHLVGQLVMKSINVCNLIIDKQGTRFGQTGNCPLLSDPGLKRRERKGKGEILSS